VETVNPSDWHLIPHGTAFEDYVVGRVCDHLWGRTVHGSDNISFTTQTLAFNPDYFNRVTAEAAGHPSEVVNPMPVFGLSVEDLSEADGPFLGASAIEYLRDVYPGQSLSAASTVIDARLSASRADVGIVTWQTIGRVSSGEPVISFRRTNQVGWRIEQPKLARFPRVSRRTSSAPASGMHVPARSLISTSTGWPLVMNTASGHFGERGVGGVPFGERINFAGLTLALTIGLATQTTSGQAICEVGLDDFRFAGSGPAQRLDRSSHGGPGCRTDRWRLRDRDLPPRCVSQLGDVVCEATSKVQLRSRAAPYSATVGIGDNTSSSNISH